ncbi:hypothetical protein NTG1052_640042 [Candidatus Nitrotoga sp. 1052]|nr:hypothetical protein NTG1052_640042 [Candidatus Nitrotoga sp. 1052]
MQLDGRLGGTKRRPWEKRQAQVDGRDIQGVDRIGEIDTQTLVAIVMQLQNQKPDSLLANLIYKSIWHSKTLSAKIQF